MEALDMKSNGIYFKLISEIENIRKLVDCDTNGNFKKEDYLRIRKTLDTYSEIETVKIFLEDCKNCVGKPFDFSNTRDFVFQKKEPIVISFFSASYNKEFGLDAFVYDIEKPDDYFLNRYKSSKATSITILKCTKGFDQYPTCVALFPENFRSQRSFKSGFSVFYFLNVFERRFQEYGKPTLDKFIDEKSFWRLKRLSKSSRQKAFATWHYLHEYYHASGPLPLVDHLKIKSKKKTAAIEESRVDALSIIECLNSVSEGFSDGFLYAELILFERLISYSVHLEPESNYDARASHILFGFLQNQQAISVHEQILALDKIAVKNNLEKYVDAIENIEKEIKEALSGSDEEIIKQAKEKLILFADNNTSQKSFSKNEYFRNVEEKISVVLN